MNSHLCVKIFSKAQYVPEISHFTYCAFSLLRPLNAQAGKCTLYCFKKKKGHENTVRTYYMHSIEIIPIVDDEQLDGIEINSLFSFFFVFVYLLLPFLSLGHFVSFGLSFILSTFLFISVYLYSI